MLKAIIFDLDDTLYDEFQFVKSGFKAVSSYISEHSNISQEVVCGKLFEVLRKHGRGQTFDIALKQLGLYNKDLVLKLVHIYRTHKPNISLYPETLRVLSYLKSKNYKLGLITDGNVGVQKNKVNALNIEDLFHCKIFSDEYGIKRRKPNSFPYRKILRVLKVEPKEAVYVGDNPNKDFITAKKIGMLTVRILRGQYKDLILSKEFEADYQIKDLRELLSIIPQIGEEK